MERRMAFAAAVVMLAACGCSTFGDDSSFDEDKRKTYYPEEPQSSAVQTDESIGGADSFGDSSSAEQEPEEGTEIFDTAPIANAYISGSSDGLDDFQKQILEKASEVVSECVSDDMTPYEKELALHDRLIRSCTYDKGALRAIEAPGEHASDPYGALIDGQAICMGYTTTFKLLMDMVQIPCGIIHSTDNEGDEHAWNIVKLDGCWYYVDTTWDDPVPDREDGYVKHQYFNITKDEIAIEHMLTDDAPETESSEYLFAEQEMYTVTDVSQISEGIKAAAERGHSDLAVYFDSDVELKESSIFSSGDDYYTFTDAGLLKSVTDACKDAGFRYLMSTLRNTSKGKVLLITFEPK